MRSKKIYIPCLRWKQGEYSALQRLTPKAHSQIMPIFEVAEIGFDFETRKESKSIDEHLKPFAKRVKDKWGEDECFVDLRLIDTKNLMRNGENALTFVFNELRTMGVNAIPIARINDSLQDQIAIKNILTIDNRGVCIRVDLESVMKPDILKCFNDLFFKLDVNPSNCDLVLDLKSPPNFEPISGFTRLISMIIKNIPYLNKWRSFGLIGTSFPPSLSGIKPGMSFLPRNEWLLYKELYKELKKINVRVPIFGDYAINHPEVSNIDMRHMKLKANIRYTLRNSWLIVRGEKVRDFTEHKTLCELIVNSSEFYGDKFSEADKYIKLCSQGMASTGNPTTWRWVGTNHHLEVVSEAAANLAAS